MRTYSFSNVIVLVQGVEITGWADDAIDISRRVDSATDVVGADGEMTVAIAADRSGEAVFRLMQSSPSNAFLSGLINAQENGAFVPVFFQFKDTGGNDLASGTQGYLKKFPSMPRGKDVATQEWVIVVERLDLLLGGS